MTTSNLVIRTGARELNTSFTINEPVPDLYLSDVLQHGDARSIATSIGISAPRMHLIVRGVVRSGFRIAKTTVDQLRRNGNPKAEEPFLRLSRELGYVSYRISAPSADDVNFADAMREFADVITVRAEAERDGKITSDERRAIARECDEAIERLAQFRDKQLSAAKESR